MLKSWRILIPLKMVASLCDAGVPGDSGGPLEQICGLLPTGSESLISAQEASRQSMVFEPP
jgi:hypothetical protein